MGAEIAPGRAAFDRGAWLDAYDDLSAANDASLLDLEDLERLATAAYLAGRAADSAEQWARAHNEWAARGNIERAARCSFWLAFGLLNQGDVARGGGWVDRTMRLLEDRDLDCVEHGYLRYCSALRSALEGDIGAAYRMFTEATTIGERFADRELGTLARIGRGRCLIFQERVGEGLALLDEAMVAVGARDLSPIAIGDAYCTVIEGCQELFDIARVRTWTAALSDWCESQPQLVLYRGRCLVYRAEVLMLHGDWPSALQEVERALGRLANPVEAGVLGTAFYVRGELHRLRGELDDASEEYRQANELGREPQPGLALLRLAQGRIDAASAAIRRVLDEAQDPGGRSRVLGAYVEIVLAAGDLDAAASAAEELAAFAANHAKPLLGALSATASGRVDLARGEPRLALAMLRKAWRTWRDLEAYYEAARVRILIAQACRALDDHDGAEMELDAARVTFDELGAAPDLARIAELSATDATAAVLSAREIEVLRLLATGATNRAIAKDLLISEKTVASHLSHIFTKLQIPSRAAATAYAYEHGLV